MWQPCLYSGSHTGCQEPSLSKIPPERRVKCAQHDKGGQLCHGPHQGSPLGSGRRYVGRGGDRYRDTGDPSHARV